jgi:mono/diheme cytochrome c family protein
MKLRHLLPILPAVVLLAGCAQTEQRLSDQSAKELAGPQLTAQPNNLVVYPDDRPSIPDGAHVYQQNCASCHTGGGAGGGTPPTANATPATSPEGLPAANAAPAEGGGKTASVAFDQRWANSTKPIDIYKKIAFGLNGHKKFSDTLSTRELWNTVVYTRSLGQPALTDKEIAAVDPVFGSNCAVCHGTKGDGDGPLMRNLEPAPANFQRFERFMNRTDDVLFDHIANGIRWEGMPNFLNKKDAKKNVTFDQAYIKKLVQYVRKFSINQDPVMTASAEGAAPASPPAAGGAQQQPAGASSTTTSTGTSTATGTPAGTTSGTSTNTTTNTASH